MASAGEAATTARPGRFLGPLRGYDAGVDSAPTQFRIQAAVLDLGAAIHDHGQTRCLSTRGGVKLSLKSPTQNAGSPGLALSQEGLERRATMSRGNGRPGFEKGFTAAAARRRQPVLAILSLTHMADNLCKKIGLGYLPEEPSRYDPRVIKKLKLVDGNVPVLREALAEDNLEEVKNMVDQCM